MTIKELETKTGMTRANIRFYEGEGLLAPKRLDNGYRDYSEEDARTLEKIKLLRQLQLDIDTIRKVQNGALTLEQALFVQMTKLEGDKAAIERAAQVCRELERSRVEYAALEPQPWLEQLQPPQRPQLTPPSEKQEQNAELACYHPWMRLLARGLDMSLYDTLINVVWLLLARDQSLIRLQTGNVILEWIFGLLSLAFTLALEPFWLHYWGWTPGKWIFGLKLRDKSGEKLALSDARGRCWELVSAGYGWNIPILSQYRMWKCREAGLQGKDCDWDWGLRYTKEYRPLSGLVYVVVSAACVAGIFAGIMWSVLPVCRGDLTVAEFARNYNHCLKQLTAGKYTLQPELGEDGRWVMKDSTEAHGTTVVVYGFDNATAWDDPEFTLDGDTVTAVTLHMESSQSIVSSGVRESLVLLALSGSAEGTGLFRYDLSGWTRTADETLGHWENVELDYRGLHISQQVEYTGYDNWGGTLYGALEEENLPRHCEKTVTISLIE